MSSHHLDLSQALRYAAYSRSSLAITNEDPVDLQHSSIRNEIKRQNRPWVEVATYHDLGVSGALAKRVGLRSMLDDILERRIHIDAILVTSLDRFSREVANSLIARELGDDCRICVLAADTGFA